VKKKGLRFSNAATGTGIQGMDVQRLVDKKVEKRI
jgi:hypothetical protein